MISRPTKSQKNLNSDQRGENKEENRTKWDFELRRELNRLAGLIYAIRGRIIQEPFKMENKNGWELLEKHLLARLARAGSANLHGLGLRDVCERVLSSVYRIGLREGFGFCHDGQL
jgi:hypothetical protein